MFEIQHYTLCDGFINTWTDLDSQGNETPVRFTSKAAAELALEKYLNEEKDAESPISPDGFRIVEVR